MADPRFDVAIETFCGGMSRWFRADPLRLLVFGDLGQMSVVATGFARQGEGGITLARIIKLVTGSAIASSRRVRALCDNLDRMEIISPLPDCGGRREKPLRFGGWLQPALIAWLEVFVQAVLPWVTGPVLPDNGSLLRLLTWHLRVVEACGLAVLEPWPEVRFFLERVAGFPFLMELIAADPAKALLSRKGAALAYGVSRRHIAILVSHAEKQEWIEVEQGGWSISLSATSRNRLRKWIAKEFAIAVLALDPKRRV
ncbi:hypothetical protein [Novosphingobium sp. PhB165]|uniref:hypothetical protein n=1 Tax=Novosphingobium sp. PhB165 TaxID=2485105 RepID=UPI001404B26B|nr:hypothetical protein [Novosphingobium sp. PhB165]